MEENKLDTKSVKKNNMRVFRDGAIVGIGLCWLISVFLFSALIFGFLVPNGGMANVESFVTFLIFVGVLLIPVVINVGWKRKFATYNQDNTYVSGARKLIFYVSELAIAIVVPFIGVYAFFMVLDYMR